MTGKQNSKSVQGHDLFSLFHPKVIKEPVWLLQFHKLKNGGTPKSVSFHTALSRGHSHSSKIQPSCRRRHSSGRNSDRLQNQIFSKRHFQFRFISVGRLSKLVGPILQPDGQIFSKVPEMTQGFVYLFGYFNNGSFKYFTYSLKPGVSSVARLVMSESLSSTASCTVQMYGSAPGKGKETETEQLFVSVFVEKDFSGSDAIDLYRCPTATQYSRATISMLFLGRLGETELAAIGFANITGYSVISVLALGMEPICGQAYGGDCWGIRGNSVQFCSCLTCFAPQDEIAWAAQAWSGGCKRRTSLETSTDGFMKVSGNALHNVCLRWHPLQPLAW
ncbi:hypothetical protein SUGI_0659360 [Cryptomeria japonica]|nr:hypothetical protein SUGI_0659360 [Cryptomeria japonica]